MSIKHKGTKTECLQTYKYKFVDLLDYESLKKKKNPEKPKLKGLIGMFRAFGIPLKTKKGD